MRLIFASTVRAGSSSETDALLLAESIRAFAGSLSQVPIWCLIPETEQELSPVARRRLLALQVTLIPFKIDHEVMRFPFATEAVAAALAESIAGGQTEFLAWLGTNTLVLQEPRDFLLQDDKSLGFRPVHHTLIGSRYDEPLDRFWTAIYRACKVPKNRVFPMTTHVDTTRIRPYFNAGLLITRPERHVLEAWRDTFLKICRQPPFQEFYRQDERYEVFIHQAVLSGVILSTLATNEIQELPPKYNYPLHLYEQDVTGSRPSGLEELATVRHERFYEDPEWIRNMPAGTPLKQWIARHLTHLHRSRQSND